ncbi:MAG: surface lipoprotein assembly modifier [Rhodospirillales bacterium]|nr:surface lipoprotein assembly modifier [Rhodospirillales bacterium]
MRVLATILIALALCGPALAQDETAVRFRLGMLAMDQSTRAEHDKRDELLDKAIAQFRAILVKRPELVRVRLELARAFFLKREDRLARRHFEQVLAGNPPAGVALNVNRFLNAIRARKRWSLRVGAALAPDTNIGAGSAERVVYIPFGGQLLPFRRDQEELTTSGIGLSAWLGGEYQLPLGEDRTGPGESRWRLRVGGDIARKEYRASRFDRMTIAGHVGPRWLIGRGSEVSLLLTGLHEWTGSGVEQPSHYDVGGRIEGRHRLTFRTTLFAQVSRAERRYDRESMRDGPITGVTLGTQWVASPTVRVDAAMGWGRERPELERWRNTSRWGRIGVLAVLPWGFTVGGSGALRWTDWERGWFPFVLDGGERKDLTRTLRLFAHNRALTVQGFSPQISVTQDIRTSNAQLHDYERILGELRFVRLF